MSGGLLRVGAVVVVMFLGACAKDAVHLPASEPASGRRLAARGVATDAAEVYKEAEAALAAGRRALFAWRNGERAAGMANFNAARERLASATQNCAGLADCDITRVLQAYDTLLDGQARALANATRGARVAGHGHEVERNSPLIADLPASSASLNLLNGQDLAELIEVNEPVRAALREWLTWMRPFLLDTWENYQYMRYKMWPAYATAGLPEALLFGILAKESGGKVHAVSSSGAAGPLQFMPATGQRYGLGVSDGFDKRYDPAAATQANVAYLNDQFARLNNDLALVLAAYNGGEGRMGRLSPGGTRRFWDRKVFDQLPPETRTYVPMVLAAAWLFMHPEEYGLRFPEVDADPGEITLAADLSLNELSICLGQAGNERGWFRTLRNLNPRWDPNMRLAAGTRVEVPARATSAYAEQCNGAEVVARLHAMQDAALPVPLPVANPLQARTHIVVKGETLSKIARQHGCEIKSIANANSITAPRYAIRVGQRLQFPNCRA